MGEAASTGGRWMIPLAEKYSRLKAVLLTFRDDCEARDRLYVDVVKGCLENRIEALERRSRQERHKDSGGGRRTRNRICFEIMDRHDRPRRFWSGSSWFCTNDSEFVWGGSARR